MTERARTIWQEIPEYGALSMPEFSQGWTTRFKQRHNLARRQQHGEAQSVPTEAHTEMNALRAICNSYNPEDIYNMDETGLFWRYSPSSGITFLDGPTGGVKKEKTRISLALTSNATGTDRMAVWAIGKAAVPHALRGVNLTAMSVVWRNNQKAWMNHLIMQEWLQAFYNYIGQRQVILLMDNLKAHVKGVRLLPPPRNIRIEWFPANSTSIYQPLDQGIIRTTKHYYKRHWMKYMVYQYEREQDPVKTLDIRTALIWITQAWFEEVTDSTFLNCFRKATVIPRPTVAEAIAPTPTELDLEPLYQQLQQAGGFQHTIALSSFLEPLEELEQDEQQQLEEEDPLQAVINEHLPQQHDEEEEGEEEVESLPQVPTHHEAQQALQTLLKHQLYQPGTQHHEIRLLQRIERRLAYTTAQAGVQSTLDSYFTA
jgi:hypothetical protein